MYQPRSNSILQKRWSRWVCAQCRTPMSLRRQTSKCRGKGMPCDYCKIDVAIRSDYWRYELDDVEVFFHNVTLFEYSTNLPKNWNTL